MQSFHWQSALAGGVALAAAAKLYGELFSNKSITTHDSSESPVALEISRVDDKELKVRPYFIIKNDLQFSFALF